MTWLELALTLAGPLALLFTFAVAAWASLRTGAVRVIGLLAAVAMTPPSLYALGMRYRTPPTPTTRSLGPGLEYERVVLEGPAVAHLVRIDLARPDLAPVTTAPAEGTAVPAQRVRDFAVEHGAVAINAAFFHPFHAEHPLEFYPRTGDPTEPFGVLMSDGVEFGANRYHTATVYFTEDVASLDPLEGARWAVTGRTVLVQGGRAASIDDEAIAPRTAIASDGEQVWFVAVDGRQPGYSEGLTLGALARFLTEQGAVWAVEMDGGGSTTLVDATGERAHTLNCPIHTRLPCRERPVAAQVGVRRVAGP